MEDSDTITDNDKIINSKFCPQCSGVLKERLFKSPTDYQCLTCGFTVLNPLEIKRNYVKKTNG